jgi:alpha-L-fucosidase 2
MGAMVFGGTTDEQLILNEDTLYAEEPGVRNLPLDITEDYKTVRDLLQNEQYKEANDLVSREWLGRAQYSYQPLGTLYLGWKRRGVRVPPAAGSLKLHLQCALPPRRRNL